MCESMIIKMSSPERMVFALCLAAVALLGCSKEEPTKDQLLSRADKYFAADQYADAEKEYRNVLRLAPADPVAERQLGIIYHEQGQLLQAYPLLRKAAELEPDNLEVQAKFGLALLSLREFTQARDIALRVLEKQPGHEAALLLLANAAVEPNDIEETQKLITSLLGQDKDRSGYHLAKGWLDLHQKNATRAESEFKAALNLEPQSSAAYVGLGTLYWGRSELKAADQAFKAAADLAAARSPVWLHYADFKLRTGAVTEAKTILEDIGRKVPDHLPPRVALMKLACAEHPEGDCTTRVQNILAQDPTNYEALFQDGIFKLAKGEAVEAIREYTYLSSYSRDPQVLYQLALSYLLYAQSAGTVDRRKAFEGAEKSLDDAVKLNPRFEQAVLLLAKLKIDKGSPAAAVDLLAPFIKEQPQTAQAQYLLASAYLALQKDEQALGVFHQMTELFPQDPEPSYRAGTIRLGQRQSSEARKAFEKSVEISPFYLSAVEALVDLDIAEKQYVKALDRVQKQIDHNPKAAQPLALRGKIYLSQRDFTHAEPDLLKAIELDPELEPANMILAQLYVISHRDDEAIKTLTALLGRSKTTRALMQLAGIQERLKNFDAARDAYEELLRIEPNLSSALVKLANLYSEHFGQLDKAYDLAKKAKEGAPNEPHIADTLGWILFKKGEYSNALPLLESAGKLADQPEVLFHVGMAHYMLGQEEPARVALQKAVDANGDFPAKNEARRRLSVLAVNPASANATARQELEDYLRQQPNDPIALVRLGDLQEREGALGQAVKTYEKVVDTNPSFAPGIRGLALLYGRSLANDPKAYDLALKARQAYPQDMEVAKTLGILSYRRELYPRAAELLQEVAAKRKDDAEVLFYLGEAQYQLKQWNECKTTLNRALTLNLSQKLADEAKRATAECVEMLLQ
jgi:tetratricopeptide (TPR) repeat protein